MAVLTDDRCQEDVNRHGRGALDGHGTLLVTNMSMESPHTTHMYILHILLHRLYATQVHTYVHLCSRPASSLGSEHNVQIKNVQE